MQQALEKTFDVGFQELLICSSFEYKSTFKTYIYKLALVIYLYFNLISNECRSTPDLIIMHIRSLHNKCCKTSFSRVFCSKKKCIWEPTVAT